MNVEECSNALKDFTNKKIKPRALIVCQLNPTVSFVFFSHNQASANRLNFGEKIIILEKTLNTWQRINLTPYGKINIVKTLGICKLIYLASVLPVPDHYIQEINKLTFNFTWQGKPPKIKRKHRNWRKETWRTENV